MRLEPYKLGQQQEPLGRTKMRTGLGQQSYRSGHYPYCCLGRGSRSSQPSGRKPAIDLTIGSIVDVEETMPEQTPFCRRKLIVALYLTKNFVSPLAGELKIAHDGRYLVVNKRECYQQKFSLLIFFVMRLVPTKNSLTSTVLK